MKIKIAKWYKPLTDNSESKCGNICLKCNSTWWIRYEKLSSKKWICYATCGQIIRKGPLRNSQERAQKDAENLVKELLLDIICGAKQLAKQHCVDMFDLEV